MWTKKKRKNSQQDIVIIYLNMGFGKKIKTAMYDFLKFQAGAVVRNAPSQKQRKYKNIQITEDFKRIDGKRKERRIERMVKHRRLLEQKMNSQAKLLTSTEATSIQNEIKNIEKQIAQQSKELHIIQKQIDDLQPEYMVVEGVLKLVVINKIKNLTYLDDHCSGYSLHPETIEVIENIHYCVNHNLPVNRVKLFEIMPEYFASQIGQLEEAEQRLILEKQIFKIDPDADMRIFQTEFVPLPSQTEGQEPTMEQLQFEAQITYYNMQENFRKILSKHEDLFLKVSRGETAFRDEKHLITVLLSDLDIKYLPEELDLQADLKRIQKERAEFDIYANDIRQRVLAIKHSYQEPPPYIANHPVLMEKWDQLMQSYTNPYDFQKSNFIEPADPALIEKQTRLEKRIRQIVSTEFDPIFVEQMNKDRSLIDKKKMEIDFHNMAAKVVEEFELLSQKSEKDEIFEKLPKNSLLTKRKEGKNRIKLDQITRMMYLNKKEPRKYTSEFFSRWFGIPKEEIEGLMKYISYIQVPQQKETSNPIINVLKFQL